ncbi:MAG: hypothetical protein K1X67_01565 [Fimbriimonadaceae bacterium]|nr:hypothetical protein [Fimbriimonadaceae bacterium]
MQQAEISEFGGLGYEVYEWRHASAILKADFPSEWGDVCHVLQQWRIKESSVVRGGGGRTDIAQEHDGLFQQRGWTKKRFDTEIVVDEESYKSPTHEVDCYKSRVALELDWNN